MCDVWASYAVFLNLVFNHKMGILYLLFPPQRVILRIKSFLRVCVKHLVECGAGRRLNSVNITPGSWLELLEQVSRPSPSSYTSLKLSKAKIGVCHLSAQKSINGFIHPLSRQQATQYRSWTVLETTKSKVHIPWASFQGWSWTQPTWLLLSPATLSHFSHQPDSVRRALPPPGPNAAPSISLFLSQTEVLICTCLWHWSLSAWCYVTCVLVYLFF